MAIEAMGREAKQVLEPLVAMIYFVPEGPAHYEKIGLKPRQAYFCTRASAMGAVPGEVVAATFYNFNPTMVIPQVNDGWQKTTAQAAATARNEAVTAALTRLLADENGKLPDLTKPLALMKKACEGLKPEGRPLFAAYHGTTWPEENSLLALWWGANLLREYRGDGHIAALLGAGISGLESILIAGAWSDKVPLQMLIRSRAWPEEEMAVANEELNRRGLVNNGVITDRGRALRDQVEDQTDRLAVAPWHKLGEQETQELISLVQPISKQIVKNGGLGAPPPKPA